MRRRFLLVALLTAVGLAPAARAELLMPGVTYTRQVQFTPNGPVVVHVLTAPKPVGLYALRPALSNDLVSGRERVTSMQRRLATTVTVAGVNGDFFHRKLGYPSGMVLQNNVLKHVPIARRSSIGVDANGTLQIGRVAFFGNWKGVGPTRPLQALNRPAQANEAVLFTPAWGAATPPARNTVELVLQPFPPTTPNVDLAGPATSVGQGGETPIPPDGAVLVARGTSAAALAAEASVGGQVTVRLTLRPTWTGVADALGGGPALVRDGGPIYRALEDFTPSQVIGRDPRTAVGQRADGSLVLVAVDGRQPGYSVGITNFDLSLLLVRLGVVTASALDSGGSTTMAFDGRLLNRPSDPGGERPVAESLLVAYTGVYLPRLGVPLVSPNGDGVADVQALRYKLVRASTVNARLVGPGDAVRPLDTSLHQPGTYALPWTGLTAEGAPEPEGRWRWVVDAVDDLGRSSTMERTFAVDRTLGFLSLRGTVFRPAGRQRQLASVTLARDASVSGLIETPQGALVRPLGTQRLAAGPATLSWNGRYRDGKRVAPGSYRLRVVAWSEIGRSELTAAFRLRR